jgi:hypothetical protein
MSRKRNTASRVASSRVADDLKIIKGIGPAFEKSLKAAGIRTFTQLAKELPEDVATYTTNLSASQIRKQGWIPQARKLASNKPGSKPRKMDTAVSPSHQHYENFTLEFLLTEKNTIRRLRIVHVQSGDMDSWTKWKPENISDFLSRHTKARFPKSKTRKSKPAIKTTKAAAPLKPKTKQSKNTTRKSSQPVAKSPLRKFSQKTKAPSFPEEKIRQTEPPRPEPRKSTYLAPITFFPSIRNSSKNNSRQPKIPPMLVEQKEQTQKVRLLKWIISVAGSNQPVRTLSHDQTFDVRLTLDLSNLSISKKSKLDIAGRLSAKKLGSEVRHIIGETQAIVPYSPTIDLSVGNVALEQGLYRLRAQIRLNDLEAAPLQNSIISSLEGGLFQVY